MKANEVKVLNQDSEWHLDSTYITVISYNAAVSSLLMSWCSRVSKYFFGVIILAWWISPHLKYVSCVGFSNYTIITGKFPAQRPVTRSFDIFFDLRNRWANNGDGGDLRHNRAHYDDRPVKFQRDWNCLNPNPPPSRLREMFWYDVSLVIRDPGRKCEWHYKTLSDPTKKYIGTYMRQLWRC